MKVIEVEIEDIILEELKIGSNKISYSNLRKQIARAEATKSLQECNNIAKEEGLDNMSEEDVINIVSEVRTTYDKSSN